MCRACFPGPEENNRWPFSQVWRDDGRRAGCSARRRRRPCVQSGFQPTRVEACSPVRRVLTNTVAVLTWVYRGLFVEILVQFRKLINWISLCLRPKQSFFYL